MQQAGDAPDLELVLTVVTEQHIVRPTKAPSPAEVAEVAMNASDEWWGEFCDHVRKKNRSRHQALLSTFVDPELTEVGGFGMSPGDSLALLELRDAIDTHIGWNDHASEEAGDYVARVAEAGAELAQGRAVEPNPNYDLSMSPATMAALQRGLEDVRAGRVAPITPTPIESLIEELDKIDHVLETFGFDSTRQAQEMQGAFERLRRLEEERGPLLAAAAPVPELKNKIQRQRSELRRLNAAERLRHQTLALAQHQHAVYVNPQAEKRRIASLVRAMKVLFEGAPPDNFTERSAGSFVDLMSAWEEALK